MTNDYRVVSACENHALAVHQAALGTPNTSQR
jgi:hypothetical protein